MSAGYRRAALAVGLAAGIHSAHPGPLAAAQRWRPDDRVLVTEFGFVSAVAASPWIVYAATPRGLLIYDRAARVWRPPVTWLDGYPRTRIVVALADAVGDAVWFGTAEGWARYDPQLRQWERGFVAGGVRALAFDTRDLASGIFVLGGAGWAFLPRGALVPLPGTPPPPAQRIESLDPRTALERAPMADAMRALILTDARLRSHQFTSAAATLDRSDIFFGTTGMGVVRVDGMTGEWEALTYGLPAPAAGAVAAGAGGVWAAALARPGERAGVAWVWADATEVRVIERPGAVGTPFQEARRLLAGDGIEIDTRSNQLEITCQLEIAFGILVSTVLHSLDKLPAERIDTNSAYPRESVETKGRIDVAAGTDPAEPGFEMKGFGATNTSFNVCSEPMTD